jgi:hypothetical protein
MKKNISETILDNALNGAGNQYFLGIEAANIGDLELAGQHIQAAELLEKLAGIVWDDCICTPEIAVVCPVCAEYARVRYPEIPFGGEL